LTRLFTSVLEAVDPREAVRHHAQRRGSILSIDSDRLDLRSYRRVVVVGAGKAALPMAQAMEDILGRYLETGLIVTKYGHGGATRKIRVMEAGHPVPDQAGVEGANKLLELVCSLTRDDLLMVLLSGGASALLPAPAAGISLKDKQDTTSLLLRSGATIQEMNTVRKHLSRLKGGQLAAATKARVVSLILSDVIGDDLSTIGSGPTAPDVTTYRDAVRILQSYRVWSKIPVPVRRHLLRGRRGTVKETPKPGSSVFHRVTHHLVGNNRAAVETAAEVCATDGVTPLVLTTELVGEAKAAATLFGSLARQVVQRGRPVHRPCCLIAGGELTVTVRGRGTGGRAQEFALAAAKEIHGLPNVYVAGLGTDGTDGPTDAAGAVVDGETVIRASKRRLNIPRALSDNNAYPLLKSLRQLIVTGPTGTNVNDLYLLLVL
jgi:glycerate-2-kinase